MTSLNIFRRLAGRVINDQADKDFDGHVERTRNQPLAGRAGAAARPAGAAPQWPDHRPQCVGGRSGGQLSWPVEPPVSVWSAMTF